MSSPLPGYAGHFGINNIPFGVASSKASQKPSVVSRFEDDVIFLSKLQGAFDGVSDLPAGVFGQTDLLAFVGLDRSVHTAVREAIQKAIKDGLPKDAVEPISAVQMHMPITHVRDFTDFSTSRWHNNYAALAFMGKIMTPPAFTHQPTAYAGRCSSLEVSGTPVVRPLGQYWEDKVGSKTLFGPSRKFDYELELGVVVGKPVARRDFITTKTAEDHIFGVVIVNDWSARDIQAYESNPLGPLNGKNAATTVSPWVVTMDALAPFKDSPVAREDELNDHLKDHGKQAYHIKTTVSIDDQKQCDTDAATLYYTFAQMLTHQAIGGAGLSSGDILATGTISEEDQHGCLMELEGPGIPKHRGYLEDGETVTMSAVCGDGVGFGECSAKLLPAKSLPA